jgi:hypothetical protein
MLFRHWFLLAALASVPLFLASNLSHGQQLEPKIWLPVRHSESLKNDLDAIIAHATTRDACKTILEAKLNDSSKLTNAKFIITCDSDDYGTQNLVYWREDVRSDFAHVAYISKEEARNQATVSENGLPILSESDKTMLVDHCKTALRETLNGILPDLPEAGISFRQRGDDYFAIFMDYASASNILKLNYTATCLTDRAANIKISVFPH